MTDASAPVDPLEAPVEGVTIVELDPEETNVGRGSLPNADAWRSSTPAAWTARAGARAAWPRSKGS